MKGAIDAMHAAIMAAAIIPAICASQQLIPRSPSSSRSSAAARARAARSARLLARRRRDWLEVLVPLEAGHPDRDRARGRVPAARGFPTVDAAGRRGASEHERYDRRRTAGIRESRGAIVAIVEDHGTPAADWPERVRDAHARLPHAVIGGVVANGVAARPSTTRVWLCDFGRYAPPQEAGPRATLTDVNVSYKRERAVRGARRVGPAIPRAAWSTTALRRARRDALARSRRSRSRGAAAARRSGARSRSASSGAGSSGRCARAHAARPAARCSTRPASLVLAPVLYVRIWTARAAASRAAGSSRATPWILALLESRGVSARRSGPFQAATIPCRQRRCDERKEDGEEGRGRTSRS